MRKLTLPLLLSLLLAPGLLAAKQAPVRGIKHPICIFADDFTGTLVFNHRNGKFNLQIPSAQINLTSQATLVRDGECAIFLRDDHPAYNVLVSFDDCAHIGTVTLLVKATGAVYSFVDSGANVFPCADS